MVSGHLRKSLLAQGNSPGDLTHVSLSVDCAAQNKDVDVRGLRGNSKLSSDVKRRLTRLAEKRRQSLQAMLCVALILAGVICWQMRWQIQRMEPRCATLALCQPEEEEPFESDILESEHFVDSEPLLRLQETRTMLAQHQAQYQKGGRVMTNLAHLRHLSVLHVEDHQPEELPDLPGDSVQTFPRFRGRVLKLPLDMQMQNMVGDGQDVAGGNTSNGHLETERYDLAEEDSDMGLAGMSSHTRRDNAGAKLVMTRPQATTLAASKPSTSTWSTPIVQMSTPLCQAEGI